jgi:hypothetical protein
MFAEDLSLFFDVDGGFGVFATRTPSGGAAEAQAQAVIFNVNGLNVEEFDIVTTEPSCIVPTSTWPALAEGDSLAIAAVNYRVRQAYEVAHLARS